jgi:hypothetical protein
VACSYHNKPTRKEKDNAKRLGILSMGEERKGRRWNWYLATVSKVTAWQN